MDRQSSAARLPLPDEPLPPYVGGIVRSFKHHREDLKKELGQCIWDVKLLKENVKLLNLQQSIAEAEICELRAALGYDYAHDRECTLEKELVMEKVAFKTGSAAAVVCKVFQYMDKELWNRGDDFANNILGVVACLGIAQTNDVSRVLANYLEETLMLAIVCKSRVFASNLVKHEPRGQVLSVCGLHELAAQLGLPINKRDLIICLDDLRPYTGEFCSDSQRKLALQSPTLSNGMSPPGYLGFAVNMIDPGVGCCHWKTSSGYGLRETLFYSLFGELQVYKTREDMNRARSCITNGAVSLDGDMIKGGFSALGCWEPEIKFPVICSETRKHFSACSAKIIKQIDEKEEKIQETVAQLAKEEEKHAKVEKKFEKLLEEYVKFLKEMEPLMRDFSIVNLIGPENNFSG